MSGKKKPKRKFSGDPGSFRVWQNQCQECKALNPTKEGEMPTSCSICGSRIEAMTADDTRADFWTGVSGARFREIDRKIRAAMDRRKRVGATLG